MSVEGVPSDRSVHTYHLTLEICLTRKRNPSISYSHTIQTSNQGHPRATATEMSTQCPALGLHDDRPTQRVHTLKNPHSGMDGGHFKSSSHFGPPSLRSSEVVSKKLYYNGKSDINPAAFRAAVVNPGQPVPRVRARPGQTQ